MRATPLLFLLVIGAGCGGPVAGECGPDSCAGCCDSTGVCQGGTATDSCGASGLACDVCITGQACVAGACRAACTPQTCSANSCGQVPDGCGGTLECGGCSGGLNCGGGGPNVCGAGSCSPKTCAGQLFECGKVSDGCAAVLECGACAGGTTCGGGGPNKCGACQPKGCAAQGKNCGAVADGCGGTVSCGSCAAPSSCGAGGVANVCGTGSCVAKTCAALGKDCGSVDDGCGGTLSCGSCQGFTTCGGAGTANVCGAVCSVSCPTGFSCNGGVCSGGNLGGLVLDEVGHAVSGKLTLNGALPGKGTCPSGSTYEIAVVRFSDKTKGYAAAVSITCSTTDFGFATLLPPGTYEVRVERGYYASSYGINLLPVSYLAQAALTVSAPVSNLVLDEIGYPVSGKVTLNGALPSKGTCPSGSTYEIAVVRFAEKTRGYSAAVSITCSTTDFGFSTLLPPGTWEVRVQRGYYASSYGINLLPVSYLAQPSLAVSGAVSGLVLDEVGHPVSGKITLNGALPSKGTCPSGSTYEIAVVRFSDKTKGYAAAVSITCSTTDFGFSTLLPPGTYEVRVERGYYASSYGINLLPVSYLAQPSLVVSGAVSNLVLDEVGYPVSGRLTLNGAVPSKGTCPSGSTYEIAVVRFREPTRGYSAAVSITCSTTDFGFSTLLPGGTWEVRVERGYYASSYGINLLPVSYLAIERLAVP